jgi:hypothetical protein
MPLVIPEFPVSKIHAPGASGIKIQLFRDIDEHPVDFGD